MQHLLGLTYSLIAVTLALSTTSAYKTAAVIRQALIEAVYKQALSIHLETAQETGMVCFSLIPSNFMHLILPS